MREKVVTVFPSSIDSSPLLPPRLDVCSFLMAGASDLFPLIASDAFQLYL